MHPYHRLRQMARRSLSSWRLRCWLFVFTLLGFVLCRLPLFNLLGFEFSLVLAVVGSFAGADLGASLIRTQDSQPNKNLQTLVLVAAARSTVLLLIPFVLVTGNALFVRNCDWWFGLRCFVLLSVLSTAFGSAMGVYVGLLCHQRRRLRQVAPHLVLLSLLLVSLWHFYSSPAIFSYNIVPGYFPGNLYDEHIDLRAPFYWARLFQGTTLLWIGLLLTVFRRKESLSLALRPQRWPKVPGIFLFIAAASTSAALWLHKGSLGFSVGTRDLHESLAGHFETEHFVLVYPPIPELAKDIPLIADDHEFRRAQLVRDLGVDPKGRITSYIFADAEQKFALMGARNVYMAKPWRQEIYLNHRAFPHPVLRHELAHVIAGSFGDDWFGVSAGRVLGLPILFNAGLIEGLAVAASWPDRFQNDLTPHQSVRLMGELGLAPAVHDLLSTKFLSFSPGRSYTVAGSYVRYLLTTYGIAPLRTLYQTGGDFFAAYGRNANDLAAEWQQFIDNVEVPDNALELVREQYRRPGIFARPCPHAVARTTQRIRKSLFTGEFSEAIRLAQSLCADVPLEPRYRLQLGDILAQSGDHKAAKAVYEEIAGQTEVLSAPLRAEALLSLQNLAMAGNDIAQARSLLESLKTMPSERDIRRRIVVLEEVLQRNGPGGDALRELFWGDPIGTPIDPVLLVGRAAWALVHAPNDGLALYLLGRQLHNRGAPELTSKVLGLALSTGLQEEVALEATRLLAEASYQSGDYGQTAEAARSLASPMNTPMTQLLGLDWLERVHWAIYEQVPKTPFTSLSAVPHM